MTAETLKPFISSPSSEHFSPENPSAKRQRTGNLIAIGLSVTCVAITVAVLGFTVWNTMKVTKLEGELRSLTRLVESMQKRLGLDYLEDLTDFDKEYTNGLIDDSSGVEDEDEGSLLRPVLGNGDLDDYDEEDEEDELRVHDTYDDEDDDSDRDDNKSIDSDDNVSTAYPEDSEADSYENDGDNLYDDFEKYKDAKKHRNIRSIDNKANGLPVYEESFALRKNKTGGSEEQKLERYLLHRNKEPTLRPQESSSTGIETNSKESHKRHTSRDYKNVRRRLNRHRTFYHTETERLRNKYRRSRPMLKTGKSQALTAPPVSRVAAVHYHLNSTISGRHIIHPAQSKLPHDGDMYIGAPHAWAKNIGSEQYFQINHGLLSVQESGLYFIYAQIYYDNRYDRNGYVVYHNVHPFLQCAAFIPTNINKSHTCYTSGLIYLEANDQIHLRDIHRDRVVSLTSAKSFFGLIKIDGGI